MRTLPPKLEQREAVRIWMHYRYGWPLHPMQKPTSREYYADRRKALTDLAPIIRPAERSPETVEPVRQRRPNWVDPEWLNRAPWSQRLKRYPDAAVSMNKPKPAVPVPGWIDREDLIRLAVDHGIDLEVGAATSADDIPDIEIRSPGHPRVNDKAVLFVLELERTGKADSRMDACRKAVERYFKDHHDPEGKAQSIAASMRNKRNQRNR